jgi:mannose/fructose/N-acetylgalactosamine-specific phosphotransferase system component IIC
MSSAADFTAHPFFKWVTTSTLILLYVAIEFGFNYQLLSLTIDPASDEVLLGLEFWGRVLSGIGFGLLLYRLSNQLNIQNLSRLLICLVLGVVIMWNVQKIITDHLVREASLTDKKVSLLLASLSDEAANGALTTLSGNALLPAIANAEDRKISASLFPAIALYAPNRVAQLAAWNQVSQTQIEAALAQNYPEEQLANAYRNLIIPPLTLGISLFFAMLNLAQLLSYLAFGLAVSNSRAVIWMRSSALVLFSCFLLFSFTATSPLVNSNAYQTELREPLFKEDLVLGILTEWSAYAAPNWYFLSSWCNKHILRGIELKRPY